MGYAATSPFIRAADQALKKGLAKGATKAYEAFKKATDAAYLNLQKLDDFLEGAEKLAAIWQLKADTAAGTLDVDSIANCKAEVKTLLQKTDDEFRLVSTANHEIEMIQVMTAFTGCSDQALVRNAKALATKQGALEAEFAKRKVARNAIENVRVHLTKLEASTATKAAGQQELEAKQRTEVAKQLKLAKLLLARIESAEKTAVRAMKELGERVEGHAVTLDEKQEDLRKKVEMTVRTSNQELVQAWKAFDALQVGETVKALRGDPSNREARGDAASLMQSAVRRDGSEEAWKENYPAMLKALVARKREIDASLAAREKGS